MTAPRAREHAGDTKRRSADRKDAYAVLPLAAALLLTLGTLATGADRAEAQTTIDLVSNRAQSRSTHLFDMGTNDIETGRAQRFTTGPSAAGYNLEDLRLDIGGLLGSQSGSNLTVHIYTVSSSNRPGTLVHTLTSPVTLAFNFNTFTAPSGATLAGNTRYMVAFAGTAGGASSIKIRQVTSDSEDSHSLPGWTIENAMRANGTLIGTGSSLRFEVRGSIINTAPTGLPTITQVGRELIAHTDAIADADGVGNATYEYQWIDVDGTTDTDITNAIDRTYPLTAADEGKTIKVKVTFTDDAGSREELTSATKTVQVPPETPANLTARAVAPMQVRLTWDRNLPSLKDLDLEDPPGYRIEWSADGDAPWTSLVNITNQHVTDSDIWCACYPTRYNDDTIAPGTTRYYRIQAVDEDGDASAWSTAVSATTAGLVDSDQGEFDFGAVESSLDSFTDQKVFRIVLEGNTEYRFRISRRARVIVIGPQRTEVMNEVLEPNNGLIERFTTQAAGEHRVKISHGGNLSAGPFHFILVPKHDRGVSDNTFGAGEESNAIFNTYGDTDQFGLRVQPGKAYRVRVLGREDLGSFTAARPRISRAHDPSSGYSEHNMAKPWVPGVTTTAASPLCWKFSEPEKCEFQAFVIDLREQTGAQQTWHIDVSPTLRPDTRPYRVGTYQVQLRELSASQLQGVRSLQGRFVSPPERHDGEKRIKVRVEFSEPPENVGADGVEVEGGAVTSVSPVGGNAPGGAGTRSVGGGNAGRQDREVVWEFEIEPDSDGDVTVSLDAGRPCDEEGAICTADGRSLSEDISTTVEGPETDAGPPPLTASFENLPEAHDGERAFRFRVAFSEPIAISYRSLREDAFQVAGGRVTRGKRVDGRKDLFEITVEPDGAGELAISLPAGRDCSVSGAICTWGPPRKPLTNTPTATVAGPPVEPLTASFVGVPAEHDGARAFTLRIAFSERVGWMNGRRLREDVVTVSGGRATSASRVDRRRDLWKVTVEPDSLADVTVTLAAGAACRTPAAVCTSDGRALSNSISATVRGPVAVSVADARAEEGTDETIDFAVTLSRAASATVAVAYATADGTATAGADYTRTSGTLTFAPGETATTVRVPVLDDAHDEGEETLTLRLSAASGAVLADGTATGTIENSDPLQRAWLARFGRTAATHVTDAVSDRLRGTPGQDSHVTVGGYRLPVGQRAAEDGADDGVSGVERLVLALGQRLGLGTGPAPAGARGWPDATDPRLGQSRTLDVGSALNLRQVLLGSSFRLALGGDAVGARNLRLTAWGRVAGTTFDGQDGALSLNGDVLTGTVGVDGEWDRLLAGLAVAHSRGDGSYTMPVTGGQDRGDLEQTLTSIHPYLRYAVTDRLAVWGLFGYGWGELDLEPDTDDTMETDTTLVMGAFGGRGILLAAPESGGFQLATRTDAMLTRTSSDAVQTVDGNMASGDAEAHRLRLVLEGSRGFAWAEGRRLTPTMEVGLRHDWGDAETGFGLELGGRVQYADPALGLTIDATVRGLLAHEDDDYQEWGASGTVRIAPGATGQGLSLTLAPAWGATASGVNGLWSRQTTAGLAPQGTRQTPAGRLNAEVGYGFAPFDTGLLTPYAGTVLTEGAARTYRVGTRLQLGGPGARGLTLNLEGTRQEPAGQQPVNQGLRLQVTWGF